MSDGNGISTMASSRPKNKNFDDVDVEQNAEEIRETRVAAGNPRYLAALIVIIGLLVSLAFILVGVKGAQNDQDLLFERQATELVSAIEATWHDYKIAALWIHEACRQPGDQKNDSDDSTISFCSREGFHQVYDYLGASNLEFRAISFAPNVTNEQRSQLEKESEAYYQEDHPEVHFAGFVGLEPDFKSPLGMSVQPRSQQPFYFPQYLLEPEDGNDRLIEFDLYSSQQRAINFAVENFTPMVSSPSSAISSAVESLSPMVSSPSFIIPPDQANYVILVHPGLHLQKTQTKSLLGLR
jgi:hypothetical protein